MIESFGRRGSAAFEFAAGLPVILALLLGTVEYSMMFGQRAASVEAAREAAWAVALDDATVSAAQARAVSVLEGRGVDCSAGACRVELEIVGSDPALVQCDVWVRYASLTGFVPTPEWIGSRHDIVLEE